MRSTVGNIGFNARSGSKAIGYPTRAKACTCGRQVVDLNDGTCISCGHMPRELIDRAWSEHAHRNRRSTPRSLRPFREGKSGRLFRTAA